MNLKKLSNYFLFFALFIFIFSLNYFIYLQLNNKNIETLFIAIGLLDLILLALLSYIFFINRKNEIRETPSDAYDFLANMTHELRTPLTGILGFVSLLKESKLEDEQYHFVETIEKSSNNLLTLVNNILDYSKTEAGKIELDNHPFDMIETIEESVEGYITKVADKYIELGLYIDPSLPKNLLGDSVKISQVILNLLSNAIKFTPEHGLVNISIVKSSESEDEIEVNFSVKDSGIGISQDKIEKIFEAFSQAEVSTTREFGGTGLGLSISSSFVEMMGGKLEIKSEEHDGTTFFFSLRLKKEKSLIVREGYNLNQKSVAYVIPREDKTYQIIDKNLEHYIHSTNANYQTYYQDEVFRLKTLPEILFINHRYSLEEGLLDRFLALKTKIILITCADIEKMTTLYEKSVSNFIFKPINYSKTINALTFKEEEKIEKVDISCEVLVAEDNTINQKLIHRLLLNMKLNVTLANNGLEAFELYKKNRYNIVLMDIQMPIMSGIDATKKILMYEKEKALPHTPIIAVTANNSRENIKEYLEIGMDGYLAKPINVKKLESVMQEYTQSDKKTILLYKDNQLTTKIYTSMLEQLGYVVDACFDKDVFIDKFSNKLYSMVLFDTETFDNFQETNFICNIAISSTVPSFAFSTNVNYEKCSILLSPTIYGRELQYTLENLEERVEN